MNKNISRNEQYHRRTYFLPLSPHSNTDDFFFFFVELFILSGSFSFHFFERHVKSKPCKLAFNGISRNDPTSSLLLLSFFFVLSLVVSFLFERLRGRSVAVSTVFSFPRHGRARIDGTTRIRDSRARNRSIPIRRGQRGGRARMDWEKRDRLSGDYDQTKRGANKRGRECYLIIG